MKRLKYRLYIVFIVFALIISACGSSKPADTSDEHTEDGLHANGDIQELTASADVLPSFLDSQREEIRMVYGIAGQAADILEWMPCYCGCGESAGHKSNMNCFIKDINADGSILWDDHGTRCGVCLQIAVESVKLKQDGKSLKEIRTFIDEKYKKGYAKPTDTKMPA